MAAKTKVGILDYGVGNLRSVTNAVEHVGAIAIVSSDVEALDGSSHLILPGVGAFPHGMASLQKNNLEKFLKNYLASGRPCLGICLGMQLFMENSSEFSRTKGLGLLSGSVEALSTMAPNPETEYRFPNVGWLPARLTETHEPLAKQLFADLTPHDTFYFVHSYAISHTCSAMVAQSHYCDIPFASAVAKENLVGTQFHPEKSGAAGLKVLSNFVEF